MAYEGDLPGIVLGRIQDISRQKELEQAYMKSRRVNQFLLEGDVYKRQPQHYGLLLLQACLSMPVNSSQREMPSQICMKTWLQSRRQEPPMII